MITKFVKSYKSWLGIAAFGLALPLLGSLLSATILNDWHFRDTYSHAIIEIAGALAAIAVFFLIYFGKASDLLSNREVSWISSAMITMGILDLFHALVPPGNTFVWLHSLATFAGGMCFVALYLLQNKKISKQNVPFYILFVTLLATACSLLFPAILPTMFAGKGEFSVAARLLNILGGVGFLFGTYYFYRKSRKEKTQHYNLLAAHCLLFAMAGILFEQSTIWDAAWWWWHVLRLLAYAILGAFFIQNISRSVFTLRGKVTIIAFTASLFTSALLGYFFYQLHIDTLEKQTNQRLVEEVRIARPLLANFYNVIKNDLDLLVGTPPIQGIIRAQKNNGIDPQDKSTYQQWQTRLEDIFVAMIRSKPAYTQIRYIGINDKGRELVRVNKNRNNIERVNRNKLQQKSGESYFQQALSTPVNTIFYSAVTLNRENGKIQIPHLPVIRALIPVYDSAQNMFGMIIINAAYEQLLKDTFNEIASSAEIYVVNNQEHYLHKNIEENNWKLNLDKPAKGTNNASVVQAILNNSSDSNSVKISTNTTAHTLSFTKFRYDQLKPDRFIAIGLSVPETYIINLTKDFRHNAILMIVFVTLVMATLGLLFGSYIAAPIEKVISGIEKYRKGEKEIVIPVANRDETGKLAHVFTDLVKSLYDSKAQSNAIIDSAVDGIIAIDARGCIELFNPACERLFGYSKEEVVGQNIKMLMPEKYAESHDHHLAQYRKTGEKNIIGRGRELTGKRKDGSEFPFDLSVSEIELNNRKIFCSVIHDISERKAMEQERENMIELLQKSNSELDEFAYIASHDLKAPLRVIDNASTWLEEDLEEMLDDDSRENIQLLRSRVSRMEKLLDDLLEYSRIGRKLDHSHSDMVSGKEIIQNIRELLSPPPSFKLTSTPAFDNIEVARMPLQQVLLNLINNAIKHHDKSSGEIKVDVKQMKDFYEFEVTDDGPGIEPRLQDKAFKLFQTLKPRDEVEGSGMGLAYVKKTVESVNGSISLESEAGKGCTFRFTYPVSPDKILKEAS